MQKSLTSVGEEEEQGEEEEVGKVSTLVHSVNLLLQGG